jgi:hypothetical protein
MVLELRAGLELEKVLSSRRSCKRKRSTLAAGRQDRNGGSDGTRTRDLRRDRPGVYLAKSKLVPTFRRPELPGNQLLVGTVPGHTDAPSGCRGTGGGHGKSEINPMEQRSLVHTSQVSRCGAKTRAGTACLSPPVAARTRCRLHGGLSPGAPRGSRNGNYTNGEWTAQAIDERRWLRSLVQAFAKKETGR